MSSNEIHISCPCCGGDGSDRYFDLPTCVTCGGVGTISTEVLGDISKFQYAGQEISLDEFYADEKMCADIFDWLKEQYSDMNWWEVHGKVPILDQVEQILLDTEGIELNEIPGGPNNPNHNNMVELAREIEEALNKIAEAAKNNGAGVEEPMDSKYNSYREQLDRAKEGTNNIRDRLTDAAKKAAEKHITPAEDTPSAPPVTDDITEDIKMENSTVTDRLKGGGRVILDAAKEGALKCWFHSATLQKESQSGTST